MKDKDTFKEDLRFLEDCKSSLDKKKREKDQAIGKRDSFLSRLEKDFEVRNIKKAEDLLEELKRKRSKLKKEFNDQMEELKDNYDLSE